MKHGYNESMAGKSADAKRTRLTQPERSALGCGTGSRARR